MTRHQIDAASFPGVGARALLGYHVTKSFNAYFLEWRNLTRRYTRRSLLGAALHVLEESSKAGMEGLVHLPWLSLLAIKWICQDRMLFDDVGLKITGDGYRDLIDRIWKAIDSGFTNDVVDRGPERPFPLRMRQILRAQVGFQRPISQGYVREAALIDRLEPQHGLRKLFATKAGVDPGVLLDLLSITHGTLSHTGSLNLSRFQALEPTYSRQAVEQFLSLVSRDLDGLRAFCRSLAGSTEKRLVETFEFPSLVRYPLLRSGDIIRHLHPMLYNRAMEGLVHTILSEEGQEYMDRFSKLFESHVLEEARSIQAEFFSEDDLRAWLGNASRVPDLLIHYPGVNVFVESKAGMFDESAMVAGSSDIFASKMRAVRTAMRQGWVASSGVRQRSQAPASVRAAEHNFLLIVTNKDVGASAGNLIAEMSPGHFKPEDPTALEALPLRHIYVVPIDDFERLMAAARAGKANVPDFLQRCVSDDREAATMKLFFADHFRTQKIPQGYSTLVNSAFERSGERVRVVLAAAQGEPGP